MSESGAFERLHPALRHHIVNSLGWASLRPVQEETIEAVLDGAHVVVLAPTAGGKTEAAFFPLLSRMLSEQWEGTSVLYLSPIRALLNNQHERIDQLCRLLGRRAELWHGDVSTGARTRIRRDPPDVLLTTPESLEAMLISVRSPREQLFSSLRAVVIDEVHAFAGDDRGWHLLSVLARIERWAGRPLQRIGLSATVGNRTAIVNWLARDEATPRITVDPPRPPGPAAEVVLDWVGSLENAAKVLATLYRDQKRLVFCDSRLQVEKLGALLRAADVPTHVTHSSLSADVRRRAEEAFARGGPGVIVSTSALELGLDVGDLDRVVQIDAPSSVASFLQRMGRTGRRAGKAPNCLFLGTTDAGFLRAAALIDLWRAGYVEDASAPAAAWHVVAQQVCASVLERPGLGTHELRQIAHRAATMCGSNIADADLLLAHLFANNVLHNDEGRVGIGLAGEEMLGRRHFLALTGVFVSSPHFTVYFGRTELGAVDEATFWGADSESATVLLLAGRTWRVTGIHWGRREAWVEPHDGPGKTRWRSGGAGLSAALAAAHRDVLAGSERGADTWSKRAIVHLEQLRGESQAPSEGELMLSSEDGFTWLTFAGARENRRRHAWLRASSWRGLRYDAFSIWGPTQANRDAMAEVRAHGDTPPPLDEEAVDRWATELKFAPLLPPPLLEQAVRARWL